MMLPAAQEEIWYIWYMLPQMNAEDTSYRTDNSSSCYAEYRRKKKPITERQAPWDCTYKSYPDRAVKATETEGEC